jgi:hypothetical protein
MLEDRSPSVENWVVYMADYELQILVYSAFSGCASGYLKCCRSHSPVLALRVYYICCSVPLITGNNPDFNEDGSVERPQFLCTSELFISRNN